MELYYYNCEKFEKIETQYLNSTWLIETCYIEEYFNIYLKLIIKYSFDIVHIHHLIFHSFDLTKICKQLRIPVILSIHDSYFICPAYTLLDGDYKYCEGHCFNSKSEKKCFMPMAGISNINNMKTFVKKWRILVNKMFSNIDYFVMPSKFIKELIQDNYLLSENKIKIIPHGIDYTNSNLDLFEVPNKNKPTKILFLGNLYPQKGVSIIKELYELDVNKNFEFHFLGYVPPQISFGFNHGQYENNKLEEYIKKIKPSFIGIFTLCGESYCYTLSEAWSLGIPVLVSKLGALKERILENGGGWFININDMNDSYSKIMFIINNKEEYCLKQKETKKIHLISTKSMSNKYLEIYVNILINNNI